MLSRAALSRFCSLAALLALPVACGDPGGGPYPRLLPLSDLNAPPAIPAHAADAAADPEAVGAALQARRAGLNASAAGRPVADAAALDARATALRARADTLAGRDPGSDSVPAAVAVPGPSVDIDPETAARAEALRQRARDLQDSRPLPPCPPGILDPAAANCAPR